MADFPIAFGTQSWPGRNGPDNGPVLINVTSEPAQGVSEAPLHVFDGLTLFSTLTGGGKFRGGIALDNLAYVVSGNGLFRVDTTGTSSLIGGIAGSSPVWVSRNKDDIVLAVDGSAYMIRSGLLTQIESTALPPAVSVTTINARSVYASPDGTITYSDVLVPESIQADAFFAAEADPDRLVAAIEHKQDLWCFGTGTTEQFRDTGADTDPFRRIGAPLEKGCCAANSIVSIGESIVWCGDDNVVYQSGGSGYEPLSHPPIGRDIAALADRGVMTAKGYFWRDMPFYELSSPSFTWVCNLRTKAWTQARSWQMDRRRTEGAFQFAGMWIFGDVSQGKLYRLSDTARNEAGTRFVAVMRSGPVHAFPSQIIIDHLDLVFETGVGLNSTDADLADPRIGLRVSHDGGRSWSNQRTKSLGRIGERRTVVSFPSLGKTGRNGSIIEIEAWPSVVRSFYGAKARGRVVSGR